MKARPISNSTSWLYQAAIHGTDLAQNQWPANAPFATCEHNTIFFLSWHRMYLHFFERIVRAASGTSSFALPYWNYSLAGQAALPPPFRTSAGNALFDGTRGAGMNTGSNLPASAVNITTALGKTQFLGGSQFQGSLEGTPHGVVHSTIGGNMGAFATAGLDPIFWLHHCNIDRLWEKWLSQGGGRVNPTGNTSWMDDEFTFSDETGALVEMSGSDVLFTASQLKYRYDDPSTCIPLLIFQTVAESKLILASRRVRNIASFVVAKDLRLSPSEERISIKADTSGPNRERLARLFSQDAATISPQSGARWSIVFEGVRTAAPADGYYEVYVNLPPNTRPDFNSPHYVGNLSLFGADEQSRRSMKSAHAGHADQGMTVALEASDELKRLVDRGDVQNGELTITLVPQGCQDSRESRCGSMRRRRRRSGPFSLALIAKWRSEGTNGSAGPSTSHGLGRTGPTF